jgi:signal transduction histidine kinase
MDATRPEGSPQAAGHGGPLLRSLQEAHQSDGIHRADIAVGNADGSQTVLRLRSQPIPKASGGTIHRIATFRDVTAETRLEEALRRTERLACIGLLGAEIAHEINNPVGSAMLAAETAMAIKDAPGSAEQLAACLKNIVASMDRCGRIVRTLLRYSRQEPTEKQACNINDVIEESIKLVQPYAQSRRAEFHEDLDPAVPLVTMNPLEIELALVNLIRNAIEAGGTGAGVSILTRQSAAGVVVSIHDNGCGMDGEQLAHAFDPLYTTRRGAGGSGLGLSIVKGIIQSHQGQMRIQSRPGNGTTVTVDLPLADGAGCGTAVPAVRLWQWKDADRTPALQ